MFELSTLVVPWYEFLFSELNKPYINDLWSFLKNEQDKGKEIYPDKYQIFEALNLTLAPKNVRVVIVGQDPYYTPMHANGLSFSSGHLDPKELPPSLKNIHKELKSDLGIVGYNCGCLHGWAKQGVLLLNTTLTVEKNKPLSHAGRGWEQLTDHIISKLNSEHADIVFMLWGKEAQVKSDLIDPDKHFVLKTSHPSPLAAKKGFLGCKHFSQANEYLMFCEKAPILWGLNH